MTDTSHGNGRRPAGRPRRAGVEGAVLDATVKLVAEQGYAGTTLDAIARRAGVAKTTVYRRWDTKTDLVVDALVRSLGTPPLGDQPGREGLAAAIEWLAHHVGLPEIRLLMIGLSGEAARDDALRSQLRARLREPFTAELADRWQVSDDAAELAFDVVVGTLLHRVSMTGELTDADADAVTELATGLLFPA